MGAHRCTNDECGHGEEIYVATYAIPVVQGTDSFQPLEVKLVELSFTGEE
jgi:hypothetical protein